MYNKGLTSQLSINSFYRHFVSSVSLIGFVVVAVVCRTFWTCSKMSYTAVPNVIHKLPSTIVSISSVEQGRQAVLVAVETVKLKAEQL